MKIDELVRCINAELGGESVDEDTRRRMGAGLIMGVIVGVNLVGLDAKYAETLASILTVEYESNTGKNTGTMKVAKAIMQHVKLDLQS